MRPSKQNTSQATDGALSREKILEAAEEVFRRFGPAKTTVVDVAKVLGMSHGSVYRHFESKIALRNAVIAVWLQRYTDALEKIVAQPGSATDRLRLWLDTMRELKTEKYKKETELFATYHDLVKHSTPEAVHYREELTRQLETILRSGIVSGEFQITDTHKRARAILDATVRFHHPWHATDWDKDDVNEAFQGVWELIVSGLQ
jgi:AcrR family transcriptional regulator